METSEQSLAERRAEAFRKRVGPTLTPWGRLPSKVKGRPEVLIVEVGIVVFLDFGTWVLRPLSYAGGYTIRPLHLKHIVEIADQVCAEVPE